MRVLIATYSETGNTAQVARAMGEEVQRQGHEVHLAGGRRNHGGDAGCLFTQPL
jgi:flavodoxin